MKYTHLSMHHLLEYTNQDIQKRYSIDKDSTVNKTDYYTSREFPIQNFYRRATDILYNITRCYSDSEYCHVIAIAAGDIIKYQGGHMMRNADARTVRSSQETFNGHDALFGDFKLKIT